MLKYFIKRSLCLVNAAILRVDNPHDFRLWIADILVCNNNQLCGKYFILFQILMRPSLS